MLNFKWFRDNLAAGADPEGEIDFLKHKGIGAIISVCTRCLNDIDNIKYYFEYTRDGHAPQNLNEICDFIETCLNNNIPVYVHCFAGIGRTGTVLAAYIMRKEHLTAEEAINIVRSEYYMYAIESSMQVSALKEFENSLLHY